MTVLNAKKIRYGDAHRGRNSWKGWWLAGETRLIPCCIRRSSVRGCGYRTEYKHCRGQERVVRARGCRKSQGTHCKAPICSRATILHICTSLHRTASFIFHCFGPAKNDPTHPISSYFISSRGYLPRGICVSFIPFRPLCPGYLLVLASIPVLSHPVSSLPLLDSIRIMFNRDNQCHYIPYQVMGKYGGKVLRIDRVDRRDYNLGGLTCSLGFVCCDSWVRRVWQSNPKSSVRST